MKMSEWLAAFAGEKYFTPSVQKILCELGAFFACIPFMVNNEGKGCSGRGGEGFH